MKCALPNRGRKSLPRECHVFLIPYIRLNSLRTGVGVTLFCRGTFTLDRLKQLRPLLVDISYVFYGPWNRGANDFSLISNANRWPSCYWISLIPSSQRNLFSIPITVYNDIRCDVTNLSDLLPDRAWITPGMWWIFDRLMPFHPSAAENKNITFPTCNIWRGCPSPNSS